MNKHERYGKYFNVIIPCNEKESSSIVNINEKLLKPVQETSYLTADNAPRYRVIMRFFYLEYEKIKYWLNQEEVYLELASHNEFLDYSMEKCRQDLDMLVKWGNLLTVQDTKKVTSIEAFRNRQFRYQLSDYSVEIERMMIRLEHLAVEGASLEPTLLERLKIELGKIPEMRGKNAAEICGWWNNINSDFIRLNQNYQDYMRDLNSAKAEELMKTKEFLVFKDRLIEYLRSFVKGLQLNAGAIELKIQQILEEDMEYIFQQVVEYEMSIPRIDGEVNEAELYTKAKGRWHSLKEWFCGYGLRESEASRLFDLTNENIRKITRYATQISEQFSYGANRKEEYRQIAQVFLKCKNIQEAHKLSSVVFGVEYPMHLKGNLIRETDSINSGVYEEKPHEIVITPKIKGREKSNRSAIRQHREEKEVARQEAIREMIQENEMMNGFIVDGKLDFSTLPTLEEKARNILLRWLAKALEGNGNSKTEDGRSYRVTNLNTDQRCMVRCTDGTFEMPAFVLEFDESEDV